MIKYRDMDTTIKGLNISKEQMINVLNEILNINLKDGVKFELKKQMKNILMFLININSISIRI